MAAGYAPHRGHRSTDYLARHISLAESETYSWLDTINKEYKVLIYTPHTCSVCSAE